MYKPKDCTEELASGHRGLGSLEDPIGQLKAKTTEVIGQDFTIDL